MIARTGGRSGSQVVLVACGVVAPGADKLPDFLSNLWEGRTALVHDKTIAGAFLTGRPDFDFERYRGWVCRRFPPSRFPQLIEKTEENVKMGIGATIDALESCPGLEEALRSLDHRVRVVVGSSFGEIDVAFRARSLQERALAEWNEFWADPKRNQLCADHMAGLERCADVPIDPLDFPLDSLRRGDAWRDWNAFWAERNPRLDAFIVAYAATEALGEPGGKVRAIHARVSARQALRREVGCPVPPWDLGCPNLLWNLSNATAAQISMLLNLHGSALNLNGACAAFGALVEDGLRSLRADECDAVVLGAVDETPSAEMVGAFVGGRVAAFGLKPSFPWTGLRGTHLAGGAAVWVLARREVVERFGLTHLGVEILGAGVSSDAEHIITPSSDGPRRSIEDALASAQLEADAIQCWDMHATGTPGDLNEFDLIAPFLRRSTVISARKGLWGHGMGVSGGWELTAQVLGPVREGPGYRIPGSGIPPDEVHPAIRSQGWRLACAQPLFQESGSEGLVCGKLSMGVGGLSACVLTRVFR